MLGPQHDDPPRDARQLPSGVILSRGPGNLGSAPSHATTPFGLNGGRVIRGTPGAALAIT